ncbi:Gas vesicle protein [Flavobacterium segetis]|uniref:Gas vesicle protein n=1 Tax=Flavobacterium segetis TaxID=271157 RepID=A0A1M5G7X6_9FLAO|nr:YtxH domain-containing protein [Flavobacterium segetis]SHF99839.1 Gas vesicle protein [Flavobacterium segetis]
MSNNTGNTLVAVLAGIAIGAGIGILYAPDKGSKTRRKVKDGFDDAKNDLHHKFDIVSSQLSDKLSSAKFDLEETYEDLLSNMSNKTDDVISFLEEKLADLKKQKAKLQK